MTIEFDVTLFPQGTVIGQATNVCLTVAKAWFEVARMTDAERMDDNVPLPPQNISFTLVYMAKASRASSGADLLCCGVKVSGHLSCHDSRQHLHALLGKLARDVGHTSDTMFINFRDVTTEVAKLP